MKLPQLHQNNRLKDDRMHSGAVLCFPISGLSPHESRFTLDMVNWSSVHMHMLDSAALKGKPTLNHIQNGALRFFTSWDFGAWCASVLTPISGVAAGVLPLTADGKLPRGHRWLRFEKCNMLESFNPARVRSLFCVSLPWIFLMKQLFKQTSSASSAFRIAVNIVYLSPLMLRLMFTRVCSGFLIKYRLTKKVIIRSCVISSQLKDAVWMPGQCWHGNQSDESGKSLRYVIIRIK